MPANGMFMSRLIYCITVWGGEELRGGDAEGSASLPEPGSPRSHKESLDSNLGRYAKAVRLAERQAAGPLLHSAADVQD